MVWSPRSIFRRMILSLFDRNLIVYWIFGLKDNQICIVTNIHLNFSKPMILRVFRNCVKRSSYQRG